MRTLPRFAAQGPFQNQHLIRYVPWWKLHQPSIQHTLIPGSMRHQHCSKKAPVSGAMQWLAWRTEAAAKTWVVESSHKLQVIVVSGKPGRRYCSNGCSAWDIGIVFGCLVLLCFVSFCFVVFCVLPILPIEVRHVLQQGHVLTVDA